MEFLKQVADLEDQIAMLKNQSGDLVNQLQEKIKKMADEYQREKKALLEEHEDVKVKMNMDFTMTKDKLIAEYEEKLR